MMCGASEISWDAVSLCASYIYSVSSIYLNWGFKDGYYQNAYVMRNRSHHKQFNLPRLLNWGRSFNATNPLDRVYALMGMPPFTNMRPWEADYRASTLELYRQVVERCILELDSLDILSYVQHVDKVREDFPSWIPQWNQTPSKNATNCSLEFDWKAGGETRVSA